MSSFQPSPEQQSVIDYPLDRPLRVSAGAGTGKTTTVVLRLAAAIEAGVRPENALGLTFTNKAAEELSDKLREALPELARDGREVEVSTYHGFAFGLLREFGAHVGVERDVRLIGPGYVRELIHEELGAGGSYKYLDLTSPPRRVGEVAALMRQLSDNLASATLFVGPTDPDDPVVATRQELAAVASAVQARKRTLGLLDYGDLVRMLHRVLEEHPTVAAGIRSRYAMVLLDEYQDTDPAQREMLRLIFGGGFPVTAVGDADQTIYEWRGASLENFAGFPDHFRGRDGAPSETLNLSSNRRSGMQILDLANLIRADLYGPDGYEPLHAEMTAPGGLITVSRYHSAADEAVGIAQEVRRLVDEDGTEWRDIAILFRKNAQIPLIRDAFEAYDIPYEVAALGGLLSVPVVADVRAWLQILDDPADAASLLRVLLGGANRLGLGDLKPLADWGRSGDAADDPSGTGRPLLEAIDALEEIPDLAEEPTQRLKSFRRIYKELMVAAQGLTLVALTRHILEATDSWAEIDAKPPEASLTARLNLYRFLDLAEEWSPLQGRPSLGAFLGYLQTLDEDGPNQELDTARVGGENVVAMLTIHRSKGLEWNSVFLPAVVKGTLPASYRGGDNPLTCAWELPLANRLDGAALPPLTGNAATDKNVLRDRHFRQELRTAYVAITRAKSRLYVSGAHWYTERRSKAMSTVMEAALSLPHTNRGTLVAEPGKTPGPLHIESPRGSPDPVFPDGWTVALREASDDPSWPRRNASDTAAYDMAMDQTRLTLDSLPQPGNEALEAGPIATSVTGLVTLAGCPQQFYWSEVDPLPRRSTQAMKRGVEVHRLIELYALGQVSLWERSEEVYDTAAGDGPGDSQGQNAYQVFKTSRFAEKLAAYVETPIDLELAGGRIRGRIDAVYEDGPGTWEIVDWKSGRSSTDPARLIQLQAYAVAAAAGLIGDRVPDELKVTFCYLGGGSVEEVSYEVSPEWLARAEADLTAALHAAQGPEFPQQPGPRCRSCDFSRFCESGTAWLEANPR